MQHELKILPAWFEAWMRGQKTCELRKDDREPRFEVGDELLLREWLPSYFDVEYVVPGSTLTRDVVRPARYTSRTLSVRICGILRGHEGLAPGYCLMSCERVT